MLSRVLLCGRGLCGRGLYGGTSVIFQSSRSKMNATKVLERLKDCTKSNTTMNLKGKLAGISIGVGLTLASAFSGKVSCEELRRTEVHESILNLKPEPEFSWQKLTDLLWPEVWYFIGAVASALIVAYTNIGIPLQLGELVNVLSKCSAGQIDNFWQSMRQPVYNILISYGLQGFFTFSYISLLAHSGERMAARMRKRLFDNIIRQDIAFFDANKTGEIIHRLTSDVQDFKSSFKMCISQGLRAVTQIVGSGVALFVVSPGLTTALLVVVPSIVGVGWLMGAGLRKLSKKGQDQISLATAVADEAVGNVRTVRAFAMEDKERDLFNKEVDKSCHLNQQLGYCIGVFQGLTNIALNGMVLGVLVVGGNLMANNQLTAGSLMSFLVSTQTIQRSLGQLSLLYGYALRGMAAGARVFEYMDLSPSLSTLDVGVHIPYHSLHGQIEFKDIRFSYPSRPDQVVIDDLSLSVAGGKVLALVGPSGGGKSTIAMLLERFYEVDQGHITIDGVDIRTCSPKWLRGRAIAFISQEPVLFATTVMENIRYGRPEATDAEVKEAAVLANAHTFIEKFPSKYETILGERGVTISGGQKQRIAIARALLKNPSIMILDEATSALDAESEKAVQEALDRAIKGRTTIIIAHRLSTVKDADVIAVIDHGKIVEVGNHGTLSKRKGLYWKLVNSQESDV